MYEWIDVTFQKRSETDFLSSESLLRQKVTAQLLLFKNWNYLGYSFHLMKTSNLQFISASQPLHRRISRSICWFVLTRLLQSVKSFLSFFLSFFAVFWVGSGCGFRSLEIFVSHHARTDSKIPAPASYNI